MSPPVTVEDAQRLLRLARILNDGGVREWSSATDTLELHLGSLRLDRIQRLSGEVDSRTGREADELDYVAMRLLLDEYAAAVAHLRAAAREGTKRVDDVAAAFKNVRRSVHQQLKVRGER